VQKTLRTLILLFLIAAVPLTGQIPASVPQVTILPNPVNNQQTVQVITQVVTPNMGQRISRSANVNQTTKEVEIDLCYFAGYLTMPSTFYDTLNLGSLQLGIYTVTVNYSVSASPTLCMKDGYSFSKSTFTVSQANRLLEAEPEYLSVFPNPVYDRIKFRHYLGGPVCLSIRDALGKMVMRIPSADLAHPVMVPDLPAGIFFVTISTASGTVTHKFVKE
jgi:hypothetical protein